MIGEAHWITPVVVCVGAALLLLLNAYSRWGRGRRRESDG